MNSCTVVVLSLVLNEDGRNYYWGAIQFGVVNTTKFVLTFRKPKGQIFDFSDQVQKQNGRYRLDWNEKAEVAFDLKIDFQDAKDTANLDGTIQRQKGKDIQVNSEFVVSHTVTQEDLDVIRKGPEPVPIDIGRSLDISPLQDDPSRGRWDQVQVVSSDVFSNLILKALPDYIRDRFYHDRMKEPKEFLAALNNLLNSCEDSIKRYFDTDAIIEQNRRMLYVAAIHILVRDLKSQEWLDPIHKMNLIDRSDAFFRLLALPGNPEQDPNFGSLIDQYWADRRTNADLVLREYRHLVLDYRNSLQRVYFACYVQTQSTWSAYLEHPRDAYALIMKYLMSEEYKLHILPIYVDNDLNKNALSLNERLTILGDKLALLQDLLGASGGDKPDPSSIESLINKLILDAKATGISRDTFVSFSVDHAIGRMQQSPFSGLPGVLQFVLQLLDLQTQMMVENEAAPLGLYYVSPGPHCTPQ